MSSSLIRSHTLISRAIDRNLWEQIDDGAVLQENGIVVAVGAYEELTKRYPNTPVVGSGNEVVLPGFVNAHHHIGLTPLQLGSADMPLELWLITRMVARNLNAYLDTLYSAFEMIASGVTAVQHIHGWIPGTFDEVAATSEDVIRAYEDIGMRVSYCYAVRDQNRLVHQADDQFVAGLPEELQAPTKSWLACFKVNLDESMELFKQLYQSHQNKRRVKIQLAPANLHWCSDRALELISGVSKAYNVPMHMHLLETAFQKEYAVRRGGGTAVEYIDRLGMLGPRLTLGHGVWLSANDIDRLAETGTCVCHNCSSNFRLRSGIAPLNQLEAKGINTAIGLDEAGINDDRDMLQEMRLVLNAHRVPGIDDGVPTAAQTLRMATIGGAQTTGFGNQIGTIEEGKAADLVLIGWDRICYPYLDKEIPLLDAVIRRAKGDAVRTVVCDGEIIYDNGRFTRIDRDAALKALHDELQNAFSNDEVERRRLSKALLPHVRKFYAGYFDPTGHEPFYRYSSQN